MTSTGSCPRPAPIEALGVLLALPLTHHAAGRRPDRPGLLRKVINRAPCSVADLDAFWSAAGVERGIGRATIAWMLKYDLLRVDGDPGHAGGQSP